MHWNVNGVALAPSFAHSVFESVIARESRSMLWIRIGGAAVCGLGVLERMSARQRDVSGSGPEPMKANERGEVGSIDRIE